jgi:hypothetical protein
LQNSLAAGAGNIRHLLEGKNPRHLVCFIQISEVFCVNVGNSLFSIVFQFLRASSIIRINTLFDKSRQKEVWQGKVWRSWWPKAQIENREVSTEETRQKYLRCAFPNLLVILIVEST